MYPKDKTAGGTWFSMNENGTVIVLLNGASNNHQRTPPYRKSRGLVVLDIISSGNPIDFIRALDLENIEPFTLVVFHTRKLWELRWDGNQKWLKPLDSSLPHIWSSWTLYNEESQTIRNRYFEEFMAQDTYMNAQKVLDFHQDNHGDFENGFVIDRENGLKTLSVTQVISEKDQCVLRHLDLNSGQGETVSLPITSPMTSGV